MTQLRVLIIHNKYLQRGGEDTVFDLEKTLLLNHGHEVESMIFNNSAISSFGSRVRYSMKFIFNLEAYRQVKDKIRSFRPDVVHVHNFYYVASPSVFYAAKSLGVPVIQTLHNYRLVCPSAYLFHNGKIYEDSIHKVFPVKAVLNRVWNNSFLLTALIVLCTGIHKLLKTFEKKVDGFIVFTEFSRNIFLNSSLGLPEKYFFIKPNFSEELSHPDPDHVKEDYFLYVGRLSEEKGIDTLLKACEYYDFKLKIIGDGPLREFVEARAAENSRINYLGRKPKNEVIRYLTGSKALLFSSVWYEGMPMVILEAFSTGTPVIASRLGNPEFMITDGVDGLLFEPQNPVALSEAIKKIDTDCELQRRLSAGARKTYEEKYSPEVNYESLMGIYHQVLQRD